MMRRSFSPIGGTSIPIPAGVRFNGQTILSNVSGTLSISANITAGPASGTVTLKLTSVAPNSSPDNDFNAAGTDMNVGDTITISLDSSGNATFNTLTYVAYHPGSMQPVLTIYSVSSGSISTPSTMNFGLTR
jgi:hypothetical protein